MSEPNHPPARGLAQAYAVVDRRVHASVDHGDTVLRTEYGRAQGEIHLVARGEDQRGLSPIERGDLLFEFSMQLHGAIHEARPRHARSEPRDGGDGRLPNLGVGGQAQVVVGAEHRHTLAIDHGLRSVVVVERLEIRVHARFPGVVRRLEFKGLVQDIGSALRHVASGGRLNTRGKSDLGESYVTRAWVGFGSGA